MSTVVPSATRPWLQRWTNRWNGLRAIWQFDNRLQLAMDRVFLKSEVLIYRYRKMSILVDHGGGDANGVRACLTSRMYRQFLQHMALPSRPTIVDVGANSGGFVLLLASSGISPDRVVCVEMNPNVFTRLQFNLLRNVPGRIVLLNAAVASRPGYVTQEFGRGDTGERLAQSDAEPVPRKIASGTARTIEIKTFDALIRESLGDNAHIDVCKIDIEGSEIEALRQGTCQALRRCRYLVIEVHSTDDHVQSEMLALLAGMGLRVVAKDESDPVYLLSHVD